MNETTSKQVSLALDDPAAWRRIALAAVGDESEGACRVTDALEAAAQAILARLPRCPDRTRALNALREAGIYAGQCLYTV